MRTSRILSAAILVVALLSSAVRPARAELALASGATFPGTGHSARPVASLAWRQDVVGAWRAELRGAGESGAVSLRRECAPVFGRRLRPSFAVGVIAAAGRSPLPHATGFHAETALAFALPEGAALELTARWVERGDRGMRGPDLFSDRFAEVTLGLVFSPR